MRFAHGASHYSGSTDRACVAGGASPRISRFRPSESGCLSSSSASITAPRPVEVRERVVFEPARMPEALRELHPAGHPRVGDRLDVQPHRAVLRHRRGRDRPRPLARALSPARHVSIHHCMYHHDEHKAVAHAFSVASGTRLHGARRAADPRAAEGRLSRRPGSGHAPARC